MTVPIQTPLVNSIAGVGQVAFPFGFRCDDSSWLAVTVDTVAQPAAAYAVFLNANQKTTPGGIVTFGVAPGAGKSIIVERVSPAQQTTAFSPYGPFPATSVEAALDRLVMLLQEIGVTRQSLTPVPAPATPGTYVSEEDCGATGIVPNSTDGTDGTAIFFTVHAPLAGYFKVFVDGVRQPPSRYSLVGNTVTFNAGYHPTTGSYVCYEYYY